MGKKIGKTKLLFIIFCMTCFFILFCGSTVYAESSSYFINQYQMDVTVLENGDLHIEEYLEYHFEEEMNGLIRDFVFSYESEDQKDDMKPTSSRYQASDMDNLKVYTSNTSWNESDLKESKRGANATNGTDGVYVKSINNTNSKKGYQIKVYSPVTNGKKYVKYSYDLKDVSVCYLDKGELYFNFIGPEWQCDIENFVLNLDFQNPINLKEVKVYPHTYAKDKSEIIQQGSTLSFEVKNLTPGKAVDARVVFPVEALKQVNKNYGEPYDHTQLEKIEQDMARDQKRYSLSYLFYAILAIAAIDFIIIMSITTSQKTKHRRIKESKVEYNRDIPNQLSLGDYNTLRLKSLGYQDSYLILATILDLVNRQILLMAPKKKEKKSIFDNIDYEYYLTFNEEKTEEALNNYECEVLNLLFFTEVKEKLAVSDLIGKTIELNKALKEFGTSSRKSTKFIQKQSDKGTKEVKKFYETIEPQCKKVFLIGYCILFVLFLITVFILSPLYISFKMAELIIGIVIFVVGILIGYITISSMCQVVKEEYLEEYKKVLGLKRFLKEYSLIKERYPVEIALWSQYLVFATLFGIADKVSKEMKEELIQKGYQEDYIYATYPILYMSSYSNSINTTVSSYTGSSSGGYSGGGSGGGGRRRGRSFLVSIRIVRLINLKKTVIVNCLFVHLVIHIEFYYLYK